MKLGRVTGTVVASSQYEGLRGVRLLVVQPLKTSLDPDGPEIVMADAVQSGPGDIIYWVGSREAALAMTPTFVPVDAAIVGHVDAVGGVSTTPEFGDRA